MNEEHLTIEVLGRVAKPRAKPRTLKRRVVREELVGVLRKLRKQYAIAVSPGSSAWFSSMVQYEVNLEESPLYGRNFVIRTDPDTSKVVIWRES